jgi:hypothetical protein
MVYIKKQTNVRTNKNGGVIHMRKVEETKQYINEMLAKLDESDEIFLKQLCVIIRKHLDRKHLGEKRGR